MSISLTHDHYTRLELAALQRGFQTVEQLVSSWQVRERDRARRIQAVRHIDEVRARLLERYGAMADSLPQIQADQAR